MRIELADRAGKESLGQLSFRGHRKAVPLIGASGLAEHDLALTTLKPTAQEGGSSVRLADVQTVHGGVIVPAHLGRETEGWRDSGRELVADAEGARAHFRGFTSGLRLTFATGPRAGRVRIDSKLDLAVSNSGSTSVSILLGKGNGSFVAKTDYPTGIDPYSVAVDDLNGDSKPDLIVSNFLSNSISILQGVCEGH